VFETMEQLRLGDHAALYYRNKAEQLASAIPYIMIGLQRNEKCLYIADDNSVAVIMGRLEKAGVDVQEEHERGALRVVTKRETYLRHGLFEPEKMISDLNAEVQLSAAQGFSGFRATGEMTWALDLPSALARMVEYEDNLQEQFPASFVALCQYDESRFAKHLMKRMRSLHPVLVRKGELIRHRTAENPTR
jgi:two-component system, chemotaxis family, sensor kinase Cph1